VAIGAALLAAGCSATGTTSTSPPPPASTSSAAPATSEHWLIAASAITALDHAAGQAVVARYLNRPQTTVIVGTTIPPELGGWHVAFAVDTRSLAEIRADLLGGLPPRISMILYDPEHWQFTPLSEQLAPGAAARTAASLARAGGRQLIVAPATNLAQVTAPGASTASAFIQTDDLGKMAPSANWVEIQAQGLERDPERYASYVRQAVSQIRSASSAAIIYAGLSTNPSDPPVTAAELIADVRLTSAEVTGYWLNIPGSGTACPACGLPRPQIGLQVLERLASGPAGS
jgi:hypothetical protein